MSNYQIRRIPLPAGQMTAIQVDCDCNYFSLKSESGNPLKVGSDATDAGQMDSLAASAQEGVIAAWRPIWGETHRFPAHSTILFAGPAGDADEVGVLKLIR